MRYHVIYLVAGERDATHVEARDAAAAVAVVAEIHRRGRAFFALLSVVPDGEAPADGTGAE